MFIAFKLSNFKSYPLIGRYPKRHNKRLVVLAGDQVK